jgi:hypothetical protein
MAIFNERRTNAIIAGGGEVHECRRRRRSSSPLASEERRAGCASDARHFFFPNFYSCMQCERGKERKTRTAFGFLEKKKKKGRRGEAKRTLSRALCASFFLLRAIALLFFFSLVFS